ncbi:MAG: hypothetical protein Q8O55_07620 [Dehalococcoidales bacterium]|nr:hypothetical protein [Dehalococcoidales bacterium]
MKTPDWAERLGGRLGGILVGGFGPEVAKGLISKYLERISLGQCQVYIQKNHNLLEQVTDKQWGMLRKAAGASQIDLSYAEVVNQLSNNRPDILAVITCTDGGVSWLRQQVEEAKKRLAA